MSRISDFVSLNFIRLLRVIITPSVTSLLRAENNSQQLDEFQAMICHLHAISLLTLSSIAIVGDQLAKLKKMNWTAVTQPL